MSFGARGTGTRQMIWRTTFNLRYLMELRFHFIELNSSVFSKSCWSKRLQALSGTSCLYQKRDSKLKVRRTLLTNHRKIIMWGHLRIAHKETHSVNNTCHSFPCSSLNSALQLSVATQCCTQSSRWVLLILYYNVIDVRLSEYMVAVSDRRCPNSRSIAPLQNNTGSTDAN